MQKYSLDKTEVKALFRRNIRCKSLDSSLLDCIADAVSQVIEENNKILLEAIKHKSQTNKE